MEEIELDELTEQLEMYLDNIMDQLRDELDQIPESQVFAKNFWFKFDLIFILF